jgi:hypothetical protein
MKRTTIFPSSLAHLAAAVGLTLGVVAAPSSAQQAPAAPQGAQVQSPPPSTHVVVKGETLWGLAQQYYGDPMLWPEIYRLNTSVVEDPHWIFPGEELHLVATGAMMAAGPAEGGQPGGGEIVVAPKPSPSDTAEPQTTASEVVNPAVGPTIFTPKSSVSPQATAARRQREEHAYRAVRRGEFLSAGFVLTQGETLDAGRMLGNVATSAISRMTTTTNASLFSNVAIVPPPGTPVKPGDLLESFDTPRTIAGYGEVIVPTGLLKVTSTDAGGTTIAQVVEMYGTIASGQGVMVAPEYKSVSGVRPAPVSPDSAITGEVIDLRSPHELTNAQTMLFLNRGADDGVHLGDIFQVSGVSSTTIGIGDVVQPQAQVLVVFTRPHTSTALVITVTRPDIRPGSAARQIYRMPS